MGLFNYVLVEDERFPELHNIHFQTKDGDETLYLETYTITKEGRLTFARNKYELKPNEGKTGFAALEGALKTVSTEIVDENYHGIFEFNSMDHEYIAKFTDGNLVSIEYSKGS